MRRLRKQRPGFPNRLRSASIDGIISNVSIVVSIRGGEAVASVGALGQVLALPVPVLAGLGFVAVFAGAANTPIASTIMAIELFGADIGVYAIVACVGTPPPFNSSGPCHSRALPLLSPA
jgi:hypothetical protein